jgi:hypothetical protein
MATFTLTISPNWFVAYSGSIATVAINSLTFIYKLNKNRDLIVCYQIAKGETHEKTTRCCLADNRVPDFQPNGSERRLLSRQ